MTHKKTCLTLILMLLAPLLFAASEYDRQLAEATAQREKAIAEASEPVNRRYQNALEQLLRHATLSNDADAVVKIKAALASVDPSALGWRFRGSWLNQGIASHVKFTAGGGFQEIWNGTVQEGRWQATSDTDAKVTLKKGPVHDYHLSDDGKSVKRSSDGNIWTREN